MIAINELVLMFSILPYILNSSLILLNIFLFRKTAKLVLEGKKLRSDSRRSLLTLIANYKPLSERKLVLVVSSLFVLSTLVAVAVWSI
jgi:hypothetical protein